MTRLRKNRQYYADTEWTVNKVREELNCGLALLNKIDAKMVTFFGAHMAKHDGEYYLHCKKTAFELGKRGYAIASGGGPGVMHAANSGAMQAKAPSIGFKAELLDEHEKVTNEIFTHVHSFHFLFVRRFIMSLKSEALIFYPGGYGTLNELFEYATLMQTGISDPVPIICVNKEFWHGLFDWLKHNPFEKDLLTNAAKDLQLLHFADDTQEILDIIERK